VQNMPLGSVILSHFRGGRLARPWEDLRACARLLLKLEVWCFLFSSSCFHILYKAFPARFATWTSPELRTHPLLASTHAASPVMVQRTAFRTTWCRWKTHGNAGKWQRTGPSHCPSQLRCKAPAYQRVPCRRGNRTRFVLQYWEHLVIPQLRVIAEHKEALLPIPPGLEAAGPASAARTEQSQHPTAFPARRAEEY
jgi:hypothetical protein